MTWCHVVSLLGAGCFKGQRVSSTIMTNLTYTCTFTINIVNKKGRWLVDIQKDSFYSLR